MNTTLRFSARPSASPRRSLRSPLILCSILGAAAVALGACDASIPLDEPETPKKPGATPSGGASKPVGPASGDPIGDKPQLGAPKSWAPTAPVTFSTKNGMKVWLLERHALPLVAVTLVLPHGSARDPEASPGLAHITADMLDEGAGKRSALEVSSAIQDLGAGLGIGVNQDGSMVSLSVLKKNFAPAFEILSDVVARPRFEKKEFERVSALWQNSLKKRADDPAAVARVVSNAVLYGPGTPYGHPSDGTARTAQRINLDNIKTHYKATWRPDDAVLVVVGDVTRDEVTRAVDASLGEWKAAGPALPALSPPAPRSDRPRLVLVDRKEAPQSVVRVVREGVAAGDPNAPVLDLINTALGGSFTSRLNQNLREDRGWTYGAGSAFLESRGQGAFIARAAVHTEVTGPAVTEILKELGKMADAGPTADEVGKAKAQDRADMVQTYEVAGNAASRLGSLVALGLSPGHDATATQARQQATVAQLAALSRTHVDPSKATIVIVGPREKIAGQLGAAGLPEPQVWDPDGTPLGGGPVAANAPKQDGAKKDAPKKDAPKQDGAKKDAPKKDAPKDAPKKDAPKTVPAKK